MPPPLRVLCCWGSCADIKQNCSEGSNWHTVKNCVLVHGVRTTVVRTSQDASNGRGKVTSVGEFHVVMLLQLYGWEVCLHMECRKRTRHATKVPWCGVCFFDLAWQAGLQGRAK